MQAGNAVGYETARRIKASERDRQLDLEAADWPTSAPAGWTRGPGHLRRTIKSGAALPEPLEELVLRFPSAPVHGFQRIHGHHRALGSAERFHTFRVLRSVTDGGVAAPVSRIFLMHTGLNERNTMGLYYQLASHLISAHPRTICVMRPFPGHMTRYPFQAFAETPLDKYLADGSHLFRQFLRYMVETQWFLSTIVRRSSYRAASGASLLGEGEDVVESRLRTSYLADRMRESWRDLHLASKRAEPKSDQIGRRTTATASPPRPERFVESITAVREALWLDRFPEHGGDLTERDDHGTTEPALHVLGYSLGGFTAQSVFMSWPFLIASCSTLLAGGALRELAPTAFADPEEWQTVLHSLRYELDDRMTSGALAIKDNKVGGIDLGLFTYFKRTFYEVFQQEYRGSFQTRLEAFGRRMLFIVGGDDPVVRPKTVLESAPKTGLNLLEIGGIGHFLEAKPSDQTERQQRAFWVPEAASLIGRFADRVGVDQAEERRFTWFDAGLRKPAMTSDDFEDRYAVASGRADGDRGKRRLTPGELLSIDPEGALTGEMFERCLDDLLMRIGPDGQDQDPSEEGVLFVLRNEIPTVLLHPTLVRQTAASLYHDDLGIARYCHGVHARWKRIAAHAHRVCFVLPWNARTIVDKIDSQRGFPSQSESAGGQVAHRLDEAEIWTHSEKRFREIINHKGGKQSVRCFDGNEALDFDQGRVEKLQGLAKEFAGESFTQVSSLPDCWIWIRKDLIVRSATSKKFDVELALGELASVTRDLAGDKNEMAEQLNAGKVRIVAVSHARYNPRFRGRLMVDGAAARGLLVHATLCILQSVAYDGHQTLFE